MNSDWMNEEDGIPHKNGYVRFYVIGFAEDIYGYLGWFDMTDWNRGWEKVWAAAKERSMDDEKFQVLRHDQLIDLHRNVNSALEEALADKEETTWLWWYNKRRDMESKPEGELK